MPRRPILLVLAATFVFIGAACGGGTEPAPEDDAGPGRAVAVPERPELPSIIETVTSADDLASVGLPEGTLPDGVTAADISVTPIASERFFGTDANEGSFRVYRLEPDGTQFKRPVVFSATMLLELDDDGAFATPLVLLRSGRGDDTDITTTADVRLELDPDAGTMTVLATIEHFSDVLVDGSGLFVTHVKPYESTYKVGESYAFVLTVTTQERRYGYWTEPGAAGEYKNVTVSVGVGTTFEVNGGIEAHRGRGQAEQRVRVKPFDGLPALTPTDVSLPSDSPRAEIGYRLEQEYTCVRAGTGNIVVGSIDINYTQQTETTSQQEPDARPSISRTRVWTDASADWQRYACVDPATPIPTSPPEPSATPAKGEGTSGNITCVTFLGRTTCTDDEGNSVPPPTATTSPTPSR